MQRTYLCLEVEMIGRRKPLHGLDRTLESRNLRRDIRLDSAVIRQLLPRGLPSRCRFPGGTDIVFPAPAPTAFPFIVPEVQVIVPINPMHAETIADPHENPLFLPLHIARIVPAKNLPMGARIGSRAARFQP